MLDVIVNAGTGVEVIGAIALIALGLYDLATKQAVLRSDLVRRDRQPLLYWVVAASKLTIGSALVCHVIWQVLRMSVAN